jgi:ADP-L-glycero-D-manno-heptose 6-epimerase
VQPEELDEYLNSIIDDVSTIFHLGAISTTTETDGDLILHENFGFSRYLYQLCTMHNIPLIYASSAATYGDGSKGFMEPKTLGDIEKLVPLNAYAWSKNLFDRYVLTNALSHLAPPQWVGLKFFNVYGPNEYHKEGQMSVVWQIYQQIKDGKSPAKLFKSYHKDFDDGGQLRDFVWVEDCVNVMLWFYKNKKKSGIYNVGTGKARSFKDLALATFKALDQEPRIEYKEMPESLRPKYQYFTQADLTLLRKVGYEAPMTSLEDGVKAYVQDYLMKEDPYR